MKKLNKFEKMALVSVIIIVMSGLIFGVKVGNTTYFSLAEKNDFSYKNKSILVISPLLTANAYKFNGFYTYFLGKCDESCLSLKINQTAIKYGYTSSVQSLMRFKALDAKIITDYQLSQEVVKDSNILNKFDKIILLHNEYVTKELFDAITNHPNVVYFYPNSLYAEIKINNDTMTLIRGHNYPKGVDNGFDWKFDNTRPDEFRMCDDALKWIEIDNGIQLDCYPELYVMNNTKIFKYIRDV